VTRILFGLSLAGAIACIAVLGLTPSQAADKESPRVKAAREKMLPAKLKLDIDKKMLRAIITDDLPSAVKEATKLDLKIEPLPGSGVTLTSSFELKGEMTLAEALDKICSDKSWGWYVNVAKPGDQKDGAIILTTNSKEHGYKEGTGPKTGKDVVKKESPKTKDKGNTEPKTGDVDADAAELLTRAKFLIATKNTEKAKTILNEIISKHADSKQATDAKKLLEKIKK
jgi:hypothetical protein